MPLTNAQAQASHEKSLSQLNGTLPELRQREALLYAAAMRDGIIYRIADYGGLRTEAQTKLILQYREADYKAAVKADPRVASVPITKWRPIAPYGQSRHNYGGAFDVLPLIWPASLTYGRAMGRLAELAPAVGLVNGASFQDLPHFELPDPFAVVKSRYLAMVHPVASKAGIGAVAVVALAILALVTRG